jgi:DNA-binding NarL/FixJ family response regulator
MTPAESADACVPPARATLLIADDEPLVRAMLLAQLQPDFEVVAAASDADEAIALAREHQPDVAIVDVEMPGGGGLRATREIRACSPGTAVLVLSSDESDAGVLAMLQAGAVSYFRKGLAADALSSALSQSIDAHAKLSEAPTGP